MKNNSIVLVLEASQGCQFSCDGCQINKEASGIPDLETMERLLSLFREMKYDAMDFYEIELGPTDLISAHNRDAMFANPQLRELAAMFKVTTINASFIHPKKEEYVAFAKTVNAFTPNNWVGLAIPIEMKHVFNDKYISRIRENVKTFQEHLPNFLKEVVLVVIFDEHYLGSVGNKYTYEDLFDRTNSLEVHENTMVDFVFHHGRVNMESDFVAESFKKTVMELNHHYLLDVRRRGDNIRYRHVPAQLLPDSHNNELIFHQGELYIRPVLNERVTVFHPQMKFAGPWTLENFRMHSFERFHDNLEAASSMKNCKMCAYQLDCAAGYVQDLMRIVKTEDCLLLRRELHEIDVEQEFSIPNN